MQFMLNATHEMIETIMASPSNELNIVWSNISPKLFTSISTTTALKTIRERGYAFNGLIGSGLSGQRKSSIFYVFDSTGALMCSKVYNADYQEDYEREVANLHILHGSRNTVELIDNFQLGENFAIILPLYGLSLHSYGEAINFSFEEAVALKIVRDVLNALLDIHARGYCFVDIKATNICVVIGEAKWVLIDAASAVPFGQNIIEYTKGVCLDHDLIARPSFDLYCVACLAYLLKKGMPAVVAPTRASGMTEEFEFSKNFILKSLQNDNSRLGRICAACLQSTSVHEILILYENL